MVVSAVHPLQILRSRIRIRIRIRMGVRAAAGVYTSPFFWPTPPE
jgi:hypothetical protein